MDGGSKRMNRSLRRKLSCWMTIVTIATGVAAGACSFYLAFNEARELQDDQLLQVALLIDQFDSVVDQWGGMSTSDDNDHDARILVTPLGTEDRGAGRADSAPLLRVPWNLPEGFQTIHAGGIDWRLYVRTLSSGQRIAVGQQTAVRDEQALDSSEYTLIPILLLLPTLLLLINWIIGRTLKPVTALAAQLDQHGDTNLAPLPVSGVPSEIEPFVTSLNGLMGRLAWSMEQQRRFIADAAHELRSPLTALTLQAANLGQAVLTSSGEQRVAALQAGLGRTRTLLEQLLTLARSQTGSGSAVEVDVTRIVRQVIEDVMPMAAAKGIDLGCGRLEAVRLAAPEGELTILVRNALDNAIRHTPANGVVDVSVFRDGEGMVFQVEDSGPGIPAGEEERVFEPFYRGTGSEGNGSGLGLAIVSGIAERLGGRATLTNRENSRGALFRYTQQQSHGRAS
jgi:two-component system OmpR family sensor kinase